MTDLPDGAFEMGTLVRFAGYSFLTSMPVLSFMLLISSRFENMWVPLGIGVAGFLSGMPLANSGLTLLLVHPFVIILKPAVAMSAQPDSTVALSLWWKHCCSLLWACGWRSTDATSKEG